MNIRCGRPRVARMARWPRARNSPPKPACALTITAATRWMPGVATMFAACVTEFSHFGMGGEAPILIRTKAGKVCAIAGVGTMPKLATAEFFRDAQAEARRNPEHGAGRTEGHHSGGGHHAGAGARAWWTRGWLRCGNSAPNRFPQKSRSRRSSWPTAWRSTKCAPGSIARSRRFFDLWPDSRNASSCRTGRYPVPGEIFRQPDLARTLRAMVDAEKKALAGGASRVAAIDAVRDYLLSRRHRAQDRRLHARPIDGLLRYEDMAAFRLEPEEPVSTDYRGYKVYKPGFWSQGPAMIEALNILEGYDLRSMGWNSAEYIHQTGGSAQAGVRRSRHLLRRSEVQPHSRLRCCFRRPMPRSAANRSATNASLDFVPGVINGKQGRHPSEIGASSASRSTMN